MVWYLRCTLDVRRGARQSVRVTLGDVVVEPSLHALVRGSKGLPTPLDEADGREVGAVGAVERGHVAEEGAVPARHRHDPG